MFKVFIISFGIVALIWALLSALTTIFYRNKYPEQLSHFERNVLYGEASIGDRAMLFFGNLLFSFRFPPIYIIAGIITLIFGIISASSAQQVGKETIDTKSSAQNINIENIISNASETNEDTITYIVLTPKIAGHNYWPNVVKAYGLCRWNLI